MVLLFLIINLCVLRLVCNKFIHVMSPDVKKECRMNLAKLQDSAFVSASQFWQDSLYLLLQRAAAACCSFQFRGDVQHLAVPEEDELAFCFLQNRPQHHYPADLDED